LALHEKLIKWGVFSVLLALVPFAFACGKASLVGPSITVPELVARGGLLLVAVGLATGAIGDLIGSAGGKYRGAKLAIGGLCAITAVMASFLYVIVNDAYTRALEQQVPLEDTPLNVPMAVGLSVALYVGAVLGSGACIALAER
jgi:hypothetical protein